MTEEATPMLPDRPGDADPGVDTTDAEGAAATDPADTLVETALRLLPVPDHAPGFWEDLDAVLAAEPRRQPHEPSLAVGPGRAADRPVVAPTAASPRPQRLIPAPTEAGSAGARRPAGVDPTRRLVPPSLRRRSNVVLLVLLIAAIALVVICGAALVRNRAASGLGQHLSPTAARGAIASPTG